MNRNQMTERIRRRDTPWDVLVVGGGATGLGIAVDAATRGYATALVEQDDFGKGTSSRSTKLIHGGVRYLRQADLALVSEALHERRLLLENAPHLVHPLAFVIPAYRWWERSYYATGLWLYDRLARDRSFGRSSRLSRSATRERIPTLRSAGLRGGVQYFDAQFDDARMIVNLVQTAVEQGAAVASRCRASGVVTGEVGRPLEGLEITDLESGDGFPVRARVVINATGVFADELRRLSSPGSPPLVSPSQGSHVVLARRFLPGEAALLVPETADGRVMFAIPWQGHTLLGTTDTPIPEARLEPRPLDHEISFILETAAEYLEPAPQRADVSSAFAGIRPLLRKGATSSTARLSREHAIHTDPSGMLTIVGGKWTTYRKMAEDCVDEATRVAGLPDRPSRTAELRLHGGRSGAPPAGRFAEYGDDAAGLERLVARRPELAQPLDPRLPVLAAHVVWAARHEMALTVEDVLARRSRALLLDARAAVARAPQVAELLALERHLDAAWQREQIEAFRELASGYLPASDDADRVSWASPQEREGDAE